MILVTLLCVLSLALNHQWLTVASSMLLLIILVVFSVVALAGVAVLSVGNDGCVLLFESLMLHSNKYA